MNPTELEPHQLMQRLADFMETHEIAYHIVGSMASMVYGEPRFTNDVDIVVELRTEHVPALCTAFAPPEYYLAENAVHDAIARKFQFNILHPASGLKVVIVLPHDTEFARSQAKRIQRISSPGEYDAWFGSPEDVLLSKLVYFQLGGGISEKHLRDIAGMMKVLREKLDRVYISEWAAKLGVATEWTLVRKRVGEASY